MFNFILRRAVASIPVMFVVAMVVFALLVLLLATLLPLLQAIQPHLTSLIKYAA